MTAEHDSPIIEEHETFDLRQFVFNGYRNLVVKAGYRGTRRVVPPAGEAYAFDVDEYARTVEVAVSPTGRSVRVWVDGVEVEKPKAKP